MQWNRLRHAVIPTGLDASPNARGTRLAPYPPGYLQGWIDAPTRRAQEGLVSP